MNKAKVFMNGRSQAIRLPREFRVKGAEVTVRRVPGGLLLLDTDPWELCRHACEDLSDEFFAAMAKRVQPRDRKREWQKISE